ncbi:MAG TPA: NAD-dependent epimerase/dehydratase family protein [Methylomirabilota bacterium]|nr:NAD-dependent epimerase/dehydratase family protein [Methylomirabilota bacterium]
MNTNPRKVLLTGGAGFVGSHVAEALLSRGNSLAILDNLDDFYPPARKKANLEEVRRKGSFEFFASDICDTSSLREVFAAFRPSAVIHLAARAGVRPSIEQPALYERVNVFGTLQLLDLAKKFGVEKFVYGSSSSVYGAASAVPFSEDQRDLRPISPYAATKLAGELLLFTYAHLYHFDAVCLRFFTVYGPRQRPDLAIHKFTALLEAGEPVPVFGDGSTARDYTYVDDIVAGVLAALEFAPPVRNGAHFEVFNLGNSRPVTLNDLILKLESATGRKAIRRAMPSQLGDVPVTWADISRAEKFLGYRPQTSLDIGLERFVRWFRAAGAR